MARAVVDGLIGLTGIVVPYMIPLVMLLVALEEAGIMQRIAFVVDRAFHQIGLHGGVAVTFLTGLGCNVPAISSVAKATSGRERVIASVLMIYQALGTFEVGAVLDWVQIMTLLLFLTFYIPCISTFAVMNKTIGRRDALFSVLLSVSVALVVSGVVRALLNGVRWFAA